MASEPISILESFQSISKRLLESMENDAEAGLTSKGISEAAALELGVPLEQLVEVVEQEAAIGVLFMALAGPSRSIAVTNALAFLAGVTWEQGRRP